MYLLEDRTGNYSFVKTECQHAGIISQQKSILSLRLLENGSLLSGGLDGKLAAWDANKYFNTPLQETQVSGN